MNEGKPIKEIDFSMVGTRREIDDGFIPEEIPDPWVKNLQILV